ncbi:MAG TPA: urea carboxylase [Steroidobacteraceae bacterium]|nr:urea carboxylase [Steroidobacteraceae bacterium]
MFRKVLIANRATIACRIIRTLRRMGIASVAVFSDADVGSQHVDQADEAVRIGPAPARESYLSVDAILAAARERGAEAIHPGYGFLSENAEFAARCEATGITFIGPTPENIRAFGLKHTARELALAQGVPLLPGSAVLANSMAAQREAERIGFPVMLKATAGGGGIGMRRCARASEVAEAFETVRRLAGSHFTDAGVFLERYVPQARHIEAQIFGDGTGRVIALGERDCSLQRRNQKVIEECPAPNLPQTTRRALGECAVRLASAIRYRSAGTVEFLYDALREEFYFLEVNTRLQVEHGVTEEVMGVDLVEWMVRCAAGERDFLDVWTDETRTPQASGVAIEARLYAEDPGEGFRPSSGTLTHVRFPRQARVESWIADGSDVGTHYDALLAKLIVKGADRAAAVRALQGALEETQLAGLESNLEWLKVVARSAMFARGEVSTLALAGVEYAPRSVRVLSGGLATTVQDYPGRLGFWSVGVPPSGPMDGLSFRLGNRLLGNPEGAAGLEWTAVGPQLLFNHDATVCLAGAASDALLDGVALEPYRPQCVAAGQTLKLGRLRGAGLRGYVLFRGGLDVPAYLASRATFTLGGFGGHAGRNLAAGDVLHLAPAPLEPVTAELPEPARPPIEREWTLRVLYGPHGAPDFFTTEDIDAFLGASWVVHYNSNRTGVRLIGPRPRWARRDGGEAGLHPSNIHDNAYAVGAVDFTGDMPIVLGPDGPSLGGFVCPFVTIQADLWKLGQLAPHDVVRFESVDEERAEELERAQNELVAHRGSHAVRSPRADRPARAPAKAQPLASPVLGAIPAAAERPMTVYRRQGDRHLLVEYGPIVLDLELRLRVHALMLELEQLQLPGVIDVTPGIRSLQVHYDGRLLPQARLLQVLADAEERLGTLEDFQITSRVVHLPLSFRDPAVEETIARYMASVREDAPWCPDNIEFIRRVNGLDSSEDVRRVVFDARYLVLGLGDVYLGAPVATPLDPRHRLVTTKYNPARTWTPPNVVGIGGAYLCIYGLEGPGGYQLFGRTIQVWNSYRQTQTFRDGKPWLLRFFDQIRFFPVTHAELTDWRRDFPYGRRSVRIDSEVFRLANYRRMLAEHRLSIEAFQARRQAAFNAECEEWERRNELARPDGISGTTMVQAEVQVPDGAEIVEAPLGGNIWKIYVQPGERVEKGTVIAAIEAMKTECQVPSPATGLVRAVYIRERQTVSPGTPMIALDTAVRPHTEDGSRACLERP